MKIFVTGACGEIGTRLIHILLDAGHTVVAFDTRPAPLDPSTVRRGLNYIQGDATSFPSVIEAMKGCDAVVHLAALLTQLFDGDGIHIIHNANVVMSWNVLRAAAELGITRVAQASSANAMGATYNKTVYVEYFPVDEKHPRNPDEGYGLSKLICEVQADSIVLRFPTIRIASIRPHWCIPDKFPLPDQILSHAPTKLQTVTFTDVLKAPNEIVFKQLWGWNTYNAVARAFFLAITVENDWKSGHEVFFIVSPRIGSEQHPMDLIKEYFPKAEIRRELGKEDGLYDCSKAERILGWKHDE